MRWGQVLILEYFCVDIDTAEWMHYMNANKTAGEEARRQLHKNTASNLEQVPTRHQLYGHLPLITKTIQVRRTRHAGHCWRNRDELISDVLLWTPTYGRAKAGRPARTYIQPIYSEFKCSVDTIRFVGLAILRGWWTWLLNSSFKECNNFLNVRKINLRNVLGLI